MAGRPWAILPGAPSAAKHDQFEFKMTAWDRRVSIQEHAVGVSAAGAGAAVAAERKPQAKRTSKEASTASLVFSMQQYLQVLIN
jgi:hypothetical protein